MLLYGVVSRFYERSCQHRHVLPLEHPPSPRHFCNIAFRCPQLLHSYHQSSHIRRAQSARCQLLRNSCSSAVQDQGHPGQLCSRCTSFRLHSFFGILHQADIGHLLHVDHPEPPELRCAVRSHTPRPIIPAGMGICFADSQCSRGRCRFRTQSIVLES